ncbi:MAG: hypothetical protein HC844_21385 [Tabrizicola sp.]|nr:hypothetical protein [Tabrizicola sp.]
MNGHQFQQRHLGSANGRAVQGKDGQRIGGNVQRMRRFEPIEKPDDLLRLAGGQVFRRGTGLHRPLGKGAAQIVRIEILQIGGGEEGGQNRAHGSHRGVIGRQTSIGTQLVRQPEAEREDARIHHLMDLH